jgi:hypothetical protein
LLIDVKLVGEVDHGNYACNFTLRPFAIKLPCDLHRGCDVGHTET